jgi:two-component system, NarL family, sensor histidine kinase FusK
MLRWLGHTWIRHATAALIYALSYLIVRHFSFSHWSPLASLRLGCVLLVPRRYWPALLIGETLPLVYSSYMCLVDIFGVPLADGWKWLLAASTPPIALAMMVVYPMRNYLPGRNKAAVEGMGLLLCCIFAMAALTAVVDGGVYALEPNGATTPWLAEVGDYFLGTFLGAVAFVPMVLAAYEARSTFRLSNIVQWVVKGAPLIAVVALMAWAGREAHSMMWRQAMQVGLFVPLAAYALMFGWRGAAMSGAVISVGLITIMPVEQDAATLLAQALMVFAMATFLMLGVRTSLMQRALMVASEALNESQESLQQSRRELLINESKMRRVAEHLERVYSEFRLTHMALFNRVAPHVRDTSDAYGLLNEIGKQLRQLSEGMWPRDWILTRGSPNAFLIKGPVAQALRESGVDYQCDYTGALSHLSTELRMALYRLTCESVIHLVTAEESPCTRVSVFIEAGSVGGEKTWVTLKLTGVRDRDAAVSAVDRARLQDRLLSRLGAVGMSVPEMAKRARLYGGDVGIEYAENTVSMQIYLQNAFTRSGFKTAA